MALRPHRARARPVPPGRVRHRRRAAGQPAPRRRRDDPARGRVPQHPRRSRPGGGDAPLRARRLAGDCRRPGARLRRRPRRRHPGHRGLELHVGLDLSGLCGGAPTGARAHRPARRELRARRRGMAAADVRRIRDHRPGARRAFCGETRAARQVRGPRGLRAARRCRGGAGVVRRLRREGREPGRARLSRPHRRAGHARRHVRRVGAGRRRARRRAATSTAVACATRTSSPPWTS